jgi:hypothetical protein
MGIPRTFRGESLVAGAPNLETCANPDCTATFKKLGDGILFARAVEDPLAWGLPPEAKQKVVWLCAECAERFDLAFDGSRRQVVLHLRRPLARRIAA